MNKERAISKINTMGKVGFIISLILEILVGVFASQVIIAIIFFMILPKDFLSVSTNTQVESVIDFNKIPGITPEVFQEALKNGTVTINNNDMAVSDVDIENGVMNVSTEVKTNTFELKNLIPFFVSVLLQLICGFVSLWFVCKLCKNIKTCTSPFDASVIGGLRSVAFSLIPLAFFDTITSAFESAISTGNVNIAVSINLVVVFAILIIFSLSYIFKYGAVLQEESDETL